MSAIRKAISDQTDSYFNCLLVESFENERRWTSKVRRASEGLLAKLVGTARE